MKVILENRLIHGIPLLECYTIDQSVHEESLGDKCLLFFNHGLDGVKEGNYTSIIELAKHGFYVVALDAYLHGERRREPFISGDYKERQLMIFDIVRRTSKDIDYLYNHHYNKLFNNYSVMGISMGGAVAFYTATISKHIKGIIPVIGSPSFVEFAKYKMLMNNWREEEYEDFIKQLEVDDPLKDQVSFEKIKVLMLTGDRDERVPDKWAKELNERLSNQGRNSQVKLISYDAEHEVTDKMIKDILAWGVENLL